MLTGQVGKECEGLTRGEIGGDWQETMEATCTNLMECFITIFKEGVRSGGGIGDVLRKPAGQVLTHAHTYMHTHMRSQRNLKLMV